MDEGPYILLYPDCSEVVNVPGTERPFVFEDCNQSDCPKHKLEDVVVSTNLANIVISDTEDTLPEYNVTKSTYYREEVNITLPDVIAKLSHHIDHGRVSRFNIARSNVWDGAVRGFKRATYSETCDMLVRFTDDAGVFEDGIDTGGPRREFLTLLMNHLKDRPIFDGPTGQRYLVYNANALREDEYFLAGKMIAVSVVHGGSGPHFLSEDLVLYLAGQPSFNATVNDVTEEEIKKALQEVGKA
ncbi:G2/M phase-specific E3 ubiquitin-protein ligase-like [Erpetoichthys calabaricus]|uniref:G2/M phase-specific E3 ubiquitin-protein ligase-like n=1 Tax=Erpetoichthys calabaricus TaxID=27687 RepID=UPI002233E442|nr:G2/M phase-specific E3 ubiquitin-protein ligase-like [Erpetoichthys calabaricus]